MCETNGNALTRVQGKASAVKEGDEEDQVDTSVFKWVLAIDKN